MKCVCIAITLLGYVWNVHTLKIITKMCQIKTMEKYAGYLETIDVSGIIEKFNIGIYYGAKTNLFCIFIGQDLHSYTKFPVIREKNSLLYYFYWKNLALLPYHTYSGNV